MTKKKELTAVENQDAIDETLDEVGLEAVVNEEILSPVTPEELEEMIAEEGGAPEEIQTEPEPVRTTAKRSRKKKEAEPAATAEPAPAMTSASRRTSAERKQAEDDRVAARNARQESALIIGSYITAANRKNVRSGIIGGAEVRGQMAFWTIYDGPVTVLIPFHEALPYQTRDGKAPEELTAEEQVRMLSNSIDAEVLFSVEQIELDDNKETCFVFGSRRNALERISKRYFGKNAEAPAKFGDMVTAVVFAVGEHSAWVTANGVDFRVRPDQLSHRYMESLKDHYVPGDKVVMQIQPLPKRLGGNEGMGDIVPLGENGRPKMTLSGKPYELIMCESRHNRIHRGSRYHATITSIRVEKATNQRTGKTEDFFIASLWLDGVDVAGFANVAPPKKNGDMPVVSGTKVMVEVQSISKSGYVRTKILKYLEK